MKRVGPWPIAAGLPLLEVEVRQGGASRWRRRWCWCPCACRCCMESVAGIGVVGSKSIASVGGITREGGDRSEVGEVVDS